MKKIMIAGTNSGCGKTTVACAVMRAFVNRGMKTASFKCGPDYIDPMFHGRITGTEPHNLDGFFCSMDMLNYLLEHYGNKADISVIEGVMGYYDGSEMSASSYETALATNTPVILVINARGMGISMGAVMKGFLSFREPSGIIGFIFDRLPDSQVSTAKKLCEEMEVKYFGRLLNDSSYSIDSRHLGLVTAAEITDLKEKADRLAQCAEENILLDDILSAAETEMPYYEKPTLPHYHTDIKIAVADDNAFCFHYSENYDLLRSLGAEIIPFSPLSDSCFPESDGMILCGGYPELYADKLFSNKKMLSEIKDKIISGMPCIAECGGFMYLHSEFMDKSGKHYKGVGVIDGECRQTEKLQHFGYVDLIAEKNNLLCTEGECIHAHEFHYSVSTSEGDTFTAKKPNKDMSWKCVNGNDNLYAGYPHMYFYSCPEAAVSFIIQCERYRANGKDK